MRLFIQMRDGQPHEHPIADWNFAQAFPAIDMNNLPPEFMEFVRVPEPDIAVDVYEVPYVTYEVVGTVVKDVWHTRPMTDEERQVKDAELAEAAAAEANRIFLEEYAASLENNGSAPDVIV